MGKHMAANGKYTLDTVNKIEKYLALGMSHKKTCEAVGITQETFYQWIKKTPRKGLWVCKCKEEQEKPEKVEICQVCRSKIKKRPEFSELIKKAMALGQAKLLKTIHDASDSTWQAAAWILERRNPEDFGKRDRVEVSGDLEKPLVNKIEVEIVNGEDKT
jgi:hypothetical protein